jgi:uncharacterized protein (DUF1015 family)
MAEFRPLSGLRYDTDIVGELAEVVAPPYDVINAAEVDVLHRQNEYNVTHLTRPSGDDPYTAAAECFESWKTNGVLKPEDRQVFYVYRQQFTDPDTGEEFPERVGLIGLLKVEDYSTGKVLPHENTLTSARADRLGLLRKTLANFEPIYGLFSDPDGVVDYCINGPKYPRTTIAHVPNSIGSSHTLETLTDLEAISTIGKYLSEVPVFIADGHHRYETSLGFSKERPDLPNAKYILMTLTAFEDEGLLVLPTHRLLHGFDDETIKSLPARLATSGFKVTNNISADSQLKPLQFTLVTRYGEYRFSLSDANQANRLVPTSRSAAWKSLDVSILHTLVIGDLLNIPLDKLSTTDKVTYSRDAEDVRKKVRVGEVQAAIIMARPTVDQMKAVSEAGDKMPQKSTFFYPKLLSGLVFYDLS